MADSLDLHPMLAAVVRDHTEHKEAREYGRRLAEESARKHREDHEAKMRNVEAVKRLIAERPSSVFSYCKPMSLGEGLNQIGRLMGR